MPPYFDLDLEALRQLAGMIWMTAVGVVVLVVAMIAVLLPIFIWRIWWWTRAICRETARLNEKMEHLLNWLIMVRREDLAPQGRGGGENFSFQPLAGNGGSEVPAGGTVGEERPAESAAPEGIQLVRVCPYCATPLEPDPDSGEFPCSCPACCSPLDGT